jgi:hypothetical protein
MYLQFIFNTGVNIFNVDVRSKLQFHFLFFGRAFEFPFFFSSSFTSHTFSFPFCMLCHLTLVSLMHRDPNWSNFIAATFIPIWVSRPRVLHFQKRILAAARSKLGLICSVSTSKAEPYSLGSSPVARSLVLCVGSCKLSTTCRLPCASFAESATFMPNLEVTQRGKKKKNRKRGGCFRLPVFAESATFIEGWKVLKK